MRIHHCTALCVLALLGAIALPPASASTSGNTTSKTRKTKAPKPPVHLGYGESRAERDKRLWRECRGKPNAGACEGYAN